MSRIQQCFEKLQAGNGKALAAFITAGDPDLESTQRLVEVMEKNGADIIELGVPFSDPIADGPVIQKSSLRALNSGTSLKKIIQLVETIRKTSQIPIVLMSSYNPIYVYGAQAFVEDAVRVGVDGVIIPDLPPEESGDVEAMAGKSGLDMIFLMAPTSTESRVQRIGERSRGFIYYISLTGTTGMREGLATGIEDKVKAIKQSAQLPVLIGFGISGPEQAARASGFSDGVIVGSAIVKLIESHSDPDERDRKVAELLKGIKSAMNGGH